MPDEKPPCRPTYKGERGGHMGPQDFDPPTPEQIPIVKRVKPATKPQEPSAND